MYFKKKKIKGKVYTYAVKSIRLQDGKIVSLEKIYKNESKIELKKFGEMLVSRPAGREAFLALNAYQLKDVPESEEIEIDFAGVKVLTPSWADEFVTNLEKRNARLILTNTDNSSVQATLKTFREYSDLKV